MTEPVIATNPKTGEFMVYQDGQWAKPEGMALNPQGQRAFLVGGKWIMGGAGGDRSQVPPQNRSQSPQTFIPSGEKRGLDWTSQEVVQAQPLFRLSQGAADPLIGAAQWMAPGLMDDFVKRRESALKEGLDSPDDFDVARTAGDVLSPAWSKVASLAKIPATLAGKTAQGVGFGMAGAAFHPRGGERSEENELMDLGAGGMLGGLTPAAIQLLGKLGAVGYHGLIEPWANPAAIKGREYLSAAGDKVDEIIKLLTQNKQIVPGSMPTAGEAAVPAGRAEFNALQESARKAAPSGYVQRGDEQNEARLAALKEWAGNPAKREAAVVERAGRAGPHYDAGVAQTADTSGLNELMARPSSKAVINRVERFMEEKDKTLDPLFPNGLPRAITGDEAQAIKLSFDDMIKAMPKTAMDTNEMKAIQETRKAYVDWMEKSFPELGTGRKLYKMTSQPINQMDVGEELVKRLEPALRDDAKLRSSSFAGAVRDSAATIKKATGEPRFQKLEDILASRQLQSVHNVQDDLARADRHMDLARQGSGAVDAMSMATNNLVREGGKPPSFLHRGAMLANYIIGRMEGKVDRKLASEMAAEMLNPQTVGESMAVAQARKEKIKAVADAIYKMQLPAIAGGAANLDAGE